MEQFLENNLVTEFSSILQKYIDSPKIMCDAVSITLSSACLGPLFDSKWVGGYGKCNIYTLLSSIPGRTRRSSVQKAFDYVFAKVYKYDIMEQEIDGKELSDEALKILSKKVDDIVDNLFIESGSKEGIADALVAVSGMPYKYLCVVFNSREFGETLQNMFNANSYENGVGTILSRMYYGERCHPRFSTKAKDAKERHIPEGMYVTMMAGMQELKHYLTKDAIKEGLARRTKFVCSKGEKHYDPISETRSNYYPELDAFAEKMISRRKYLKQCIKENQEMTSWNNTDLIDTMLMTDVQEEVNKIAKYDDDNVDTVESNENLINQSNWEHLYRFSLCYAIAENKPLMNNPNHPKHIMITMPSLILAKDYLNRVIKSTEGAFDAIDEKKFQPTNTETAEMSILGIIGKSMPNGITANEIRQKSKWSSDDIIKVVCILLQDHKIVQTTEGTTKPKQVYRMVKHGGED
jgi:hypothetical protein